jgi:hypothetical protein
MWRRRIWVSVTLNEKAGQRNSSADEVIDDAGLDPKAKGHDRYVKHTRQDDYLGKMAKADHGVEPAPGEEEFGGNDLLNKRGAQ